MGVDKTTLIAKYAKYLRKGEVNIEDALADFADEVIGLAVRALVSEEEE